MPGSKWPWPERASQCASSTSPSARRSAAYGDRISGGQALGQKNTGFAIWMSFAFLNPLAAVGPGSYVLWQNLFNSWQLWRFRWREQHGISNPRDRSADEEE